MFEVAELGRSVSREAYEEQVPALRQRLLEAQSRVERAGLSVVVLFHGVNGAGKGDLASRLSWWMDPRRVLTRAYERPTTEEIERPEYWRFWRDLPPSGTLGVFLRAWYSKPILQRAYRRITSEAFEHQIVRATRFERTLDDAGYLVLKFWMHLGRDQQEARLKALEEDERTAWQVGPSDWEHWRMYDQFSAAASRLIARSSRAGTPWHIIEGTDPHYRSLEVGRLLAEAIEGRLGSDSLEGPPPDRPHEAQSPVTLNGVEDGSQRELGARPTILDTADLTRSLDRAEYQDRLTALQARLNGLQRTARALGVSTVLVFEGFDAAGKGGAIRRVTGALDARSYHVHAIGPPSDEERRHHYLWRFWRRLPRAGRLTIFDRSWYGRVLVERIEGFATESEWRRAYQEINEFEAQLVENRSAVVKFWLQVSPDEQERRFEERRTIPHKRWKLTSEDWRNRAKRSAYELAAHDMFAHTSTPEAPWTLIAAEDKRYARIRVLEATCESLEATLERVARERAADQDESPARAGLERDSDEPPVSPDPDSR